MIASRTARLILIALSAAAIAGCGSSTDATDNGSGMMSREADKKYSEWLAKNEVPGSHGGKWASYEAMHRFFVDNFVESEGFGAGRMPTARFIARRSVLSVHDKTYSVGGVELVSLGRPTEAGTVGEPCVYVAELRSFSSPYGDAMKADLGKVSTRKLTAFEAEALARLGRGAESVMGGEPAQPTLVGAVRATTSCLECHKVAEGALLGAFSYPLTPVNADARR